MLTTIEALEKDIELFQKNIQSSNKLIEIIQSTIQAVEEQGTLFNDKTSVLQELIQNIPENVEHLNEKSISEHKKSISDMLRTEHTIYMESVQGYKEQLVRCINVLESKQVEYLHFMQELQAALEAALTNHSSDLSQIKTSLLEESRTVMSEMNAESARTSAGHAEQVEKAVLDCKEHLIQCISVIESKQAEYLEAMKTAQSSLDAAYEKHSTDLNQFQTDLSAESRRVMAEMTAENTKALDDYIQQMKLLLDDTKASTISCTEKISDAVLGIARSEQQYEELLQTTQKNFVEQVQNCMTALSDAQIHFDQKMLGINESLLSFIETIKSSNEEYANTVESKVVAAVEAINEKDSELISRIDTGFKSTETAITSSSASLMEYAKKLSGNMYKVLQKETEKSTATILKTMKTSTEEHNLDKVYDLMLKIQTRNTIGFVLLGIGVLAALGFSIAYYFI